MEWDARQRESWERAQETLRRADTALEDAERRRQEREARGEVDWVLPTEPPSVPPPARRPTGAARNWTAESEWIRGLAREEITAFKKVLTDAMGMVIAEERTNVADLADELARDVNGLEKRIQQLEAMVAVLRVEQQRQPPDSLNRAIDRMNRLLDRLDRTRRGLKGDDDEILDLPLLN